MGFKQSNGVHSRDIVFNENELYYKCINKQITTIPIEEKGIDNLEKTGEESNSKIVDEIVRRERVLKIPQRFDDYEMYMAFDVMSYVEQVPKTVHELNDLEDGDLWQEAIKREIEAIEENKTWYPVKTPKMLKY